MTGVGQEVVVIIIEDEEERGRDDCGGSG